MKNYKRPHCIRTLLLPIALLILCAALTAALSACAGSSSERSSSADSSSAKGSSVNSSSVYSSSAKGSSANSSSVYSSSAKGSSANSSSADSSSAKDSSAKSSPENTSPEEQTAASGQDALQKQIKTVSTSYGVDILCGEDVPLFFADYTVEHLSDPEPVRKALETLADTLALYPPAFFPSICQDFCESVTICLAKNLQAVNGNVHMEYVNAFTTVQDNRIWLVIDAQDTIRSSTLIHEITHVTDYRLLGMQQLNESEWNQLNPPGFAYYDAYLDDAGNDLRTFGSGEYTSLTEKDPSRIYFHDPYSRTYAMEDRARLMEKLFESDLDGIPDPCFSSPHVQTKLRFYFYTLRQAFGNGRWPEETAWETAFRKAVSRAG